MVDRDMILFAFCAYAFVALIFVMESFLEGEKAEARWDLWRVAGIVLSFIWPLYALAALAAVFHARRASPQPPVLSAVRTR
jgi:hypothetical protein